MELSSILLKLPPAEKAEIQLSNDNNLSTVFFISFSWNKIHNMQKRALEKIEFHGERDMRSTAVYIYVRTGAYSCLQKCFHFVFSFWSNKKNMNRSQKI